MDNAVPKDLLLELENLFSSNYNKLYACAFRMIGNHQDTEDVLQNAFLKAYKNLEQFKGESQLFTWVYRIVINECYRFFQTIRKLPLVRITESLGIKEKEFFERFDYTPNFDDSLIVDDMREKCLQGFLKCLPKNQRVCFLLKTSMQMKTQEIAEITGLSIENVKVTLHRSRKRLQELFGMRCSLIDPAKPCKCYIWIKYMRDHQLELPEGYHQPKTNELKEEFFKNMSTLRKIDYLYTVEAKTTKDEFIYQLKKAVNMM